MALTFLCDPAERHLPMAQRSVLWVCDGKERIGMIAAEGSADADPSAGRNQTLAIWKARILHENFNPFNHNNDPDDDGNPHVEADEEGFTTLVNPRTLTLSDARQWVRDHYHTGKK